MSFNTALSGLNAAQSDLGVTSHNIANVATVGFKESRAEFGDIFATSALGSSSTQIGTGVLLNNVAQQFNQGNLDFTSNSLDMAVSGEGFFAMSPEQGSQERIYTRAGQFGVDSSGFVVNSSGQYLLTFPTNDDGTVTSTSLDLADPLQLPATAGNPLQTSQVDLALTLDSQETPFTVAELDNFDPNDPNTYHAATSVTVYDSLGAGHIATMYYSKVEPSDPSGNGNIPNNQWAVFYEVEGNMMALDNAPTNGNGESYALLNFNTSGAMDTSAGAGGALTPTYPDTITTTNTSFGFLTNGASITQQMTFDYSLQDTKQVAQGFTVNSLSQNGYTTGRLTGIDINDSGVVRANFSNGQSIALGKVALARFANPQGLQQVGNTSWRESIDSGSALAGEANTGSFGSIKSGALETSNVDLTAELVNLITAQRNFQANSKAIETNNAITQNILNIR